MSSIDPKLLSAIRGAIGILDVPKKSLARKCKVSRPDFSRMIRGEKEMPPYVQQKLIKELKIQTVCEKLSGSTETNL